MISTYHTLLERDGPGSKWFIEFGCYDRETVDDEKQDRIDSGVKSRNLLIISTGETQSNIELAVARLNRETV